MTAACPCCGAPWSGPSEIEALARQLSSHTLACIVRALSVRPMTYEQLIWAVYQGSEPDNAKQSLCNIIRDYGHSIESHGWRIARPGTGNRGPLRLERLTT